MTKVSTAVQTATTEAQAVLENSLNKDIYQFETGISLVEDYLGFDPKKTEKQSRRLFFLEIGKRESFDEKGNSLGMKPAAIFIDPIEEKYVYGQQAKLVGVLKNKMEAKEEKDRLYPGTPVEIVFKGVKERTRAAGHYQDFDIYPLRAR